MSVESFQIYFDNPIATYFSGQHVTGRVSLKLAKEKRLRSIEIQFSGKANVRWTESRSYRMNGRTHHRTDVYQACEIHIENVVCVLGEPDADITLPPGEYDYYFALILPPTAPSSFEGELGHVRYTVKSRIIRPWRFNHECKAAFSVLNILDLNNCLNVQEPLICSIEKFLCCGCCRSRPITILVSVPFTGFVSGQKCHAMVEVDNQSNKRVFVKCHLVQKVTYTAACGGCIKSREARKVVAEEKLGLVERGGSKNFTTNLRIPALPPSFHLYCNCIDILYVLEIEGVISGLHSNARVEVPIVIGTIPMRNQFHSLLPANTDVASTSGENVVYVVADTGGGVEQSIPTAPSGIDYPEMPPPSYEECVLGRTNIRTDDDSQHLQGNMDFAPRYPTYNFK